MTGAAGGPPAAGRYRPIGDYAFLSDCHSVALVDRGGSVDWCCMPRVDSASVFGRVLDHDRGGWCGIAPVDEAAESSRRYVDDSLVLETTFRSSGGEARLIDCFTMREGGRDSPHRQLLRVVEGVRGRLEVAVQVVPRFDYGEIRPWLRHHGEGTWSATGGDDALVVSGDFDLSGADHGLTATSEIRAGSRARLSITFVDPAELDELPPRPIPSEDLDGRLADTIAWWQRWAAHIRLDSPDGPAAKRSAVVLKGLTNAPTGAIAAAPTTSLPEAAGGGRNWDYRLSWVRDSSFAVRALAELGGVAEADGFRRFIERSAAGSVETLQIVYGVGGQRRLTEQELPHLEGWRGSRPVRIGNGAATQVQNDVYGELVDLSWRWHRRGHSPDDDYWRFLLALVDAAADRWSEPDRGLWEMRGEPRHNVHSKVMCWVALDRGVRLAEECLRQAPARRWAKVRDEIRASVEEHGVDPARGVFVQAYGAADLDAALLLLPTVDFVAYDDERMLATTDAIMSDLDDGSGLLLRYRDADDLEGKEGAFVTCSFWLVECLAHQGRLEEARAVFDRAASAGNDLGLYSEEYDSRAGELLGNFPQGLSHLAHIAAATALAERTAATSGAGPTRRGEG
ncbi:MAG: glycoside hydrolase family 15 protein [Acidimicrobiales bacterium]